MEVAFDGRSYPHIFHNIASYTSWDTLCSLRLTSKNVKAIVEPILYRHIIIDFASPTTIIIRNPYTHSPIPGLIFHHSHRTTQNKTLALITDHTKVIDYWGHDQHGAIDPEWDTEVPGIIDPVLVADLETCFTTDKVIRTYLPWCRMETPSFADRLVGFRHLRGAPRSLTLHIDAIRPTMKSSNRLVLIQAVVIFGLPIPPREMTLLIKVWGMTLSATPCQSRRTGVHWANHPFLLTTKSILRVRDVVESIVANGDWDKLYLIGVQGPRGFGSPRLLVRSCTEIADMLPFATVKGPGPSSCVTSKNRFGRDSGLSAAQSDLALTPVGTEFPFPPAWLMKSAQR
ncbi:hypothetical protein Q8F55_009247 [Vanrija albida]|uniref:F-box domain-containing protein n=1 Tax=Vanrija albida TaxID=181172 RepID=A0ABR3PT41_9TREE